MPNPADPKELSRPSGDRETPAIFLRLDTPAAGQRLPLGRPVTVTGWALAAKPIAEIVVELAGAVERAVLGLHRPELVKAFPAYPQVANSGFSCVIASAAAGTGAELTVTLRTVNGPKKVVAVALTFDAASEALQPALAGDDQADTMMLQVDEAKVDRLGVLRVAGWVIAHRRVETVTVHAEDRLIGAAEYGIKRADVALAWPNYPNADSSGYVLATDAIVLKDTKQIRVIARAAGGLSREAMIAVQPPDRPIRRRPRDVNELFCDEVSLSTAGALFLKGWAVSSAGIERIVVLFEGEIAGVARLGSERPDIGIPGKCRLRQGQGRTCSGRSSGFAQRRSEGL
jgi:N-acetylmuramoyl-L-alanine amidase